MYKIYKGYLYLYFYILLLKDLLIWRQRMDNWTKLKTRTSLVPQLVKKPSAMQETPVHFLGREDPLEKGGATHSPVLGVPCWLSW